MKTALELLDHEKVCTGCQWCHVIRTFPGLLELVAQRAREEMRDAAANAIDGETCSGHCVCMSCEMLNKQAAAIRALPVTP